MENNIFKDIGIVYSNPTKILYINHGDYKKEERVKVNKFIVFLKKILNILMLFILITLTSCSSSDSIENYKGAIVINKKQYRCIEDDLYYNRFRLKIKIKEEYRIITVDCLDGVGYNVGDTIV